ncbi:hypothetical protein Lser_V15G08495 [Lactuca serriola]
MHVNDALMDNNYNDWVQEMENFLFAKNKIGVIDESIIKPEKTEADDMAWMRCDAMIKGWLTTAMENEIRTSIKYANNAVEMWSDLRERFGKETYYTKLRGLWDEIQSVLLTPRCTCDKCDCGLGKSLVELKEKERLYEFLMGLDSEFSIVRTQILALKPTPSLGFAYHHVVEDEQQRSITNTKRPTVEAIAFQAYTKTNTNQHGNKAVEKITKQGEHYSFCDKDGHTCDGCFKRIGYPDWWP